MKNIYGTQVLKIIKENFDREEYANIKVLDLGCANGANALFFANKGAFVKCIDIDKDVLKSFEHPNIVKENDDIKNIKFDSKYDIILALNVLQFLDIDDFKNVFTEILKNINKDGFIVISIFNNKERVGFIDENISEDFEIIKKDILVQEDKIPYPHVHHFARWILHKKVVK